MVITNISPSMVEITAMQVEGMVVVGAMAGRDVRVVEGKVVLGVKAVVVKVVRVAATQGNPRQVVLPHPHSGVAAAGGDKVC